ncbi:hypothetical protein SAMN04487952_12433 [Halomonas caseinilytica]|nr:hypothetical protein SAMN04487952_12433 [Halomonas caseinilytica]
MAKVKPFHGVDRNVYHDNDKCVDGNNIEKENLRQGTGGKPKCQRCKGL